MLSDLRRNTSELMRLAIPIVLARSGIMLMITVDIVMLGQFSSQELAYQSIGLSLVMPLIVIGLGLLSGTLVMCANRFGANAQSECGALWRSSLPYAVCLGMIGLGIAQFGQTILTSTGQSPLLSVHGGEVIRITGYGMPAFMLMLTTAFFLEGIKRPLPWAIIVLSANVLNGFLNWILIYGGMGFPELGAAGAAWATTISRWFIAIALLAFVWNMVDRQQFGTRGRLFRASATWPQQRRIGYAIGIGAGADSCAFAILGIFAGWLGPLSIAAFALTFNLFTMIFMVTLGIGSATTVRVGIAHGQNDPSGVAYAGWTGLLANSVVMLVIGGCLIFGSEIVTALFTNDPSLLLIAIPMVCFTAFVLIFDGGQSVIASALRGQRDVWAPCVIQFSSYFLIMIPLAYILAFQAQHGAMGLVEAMLIASLFAGGLLAGRFYLLTIRHDPNRFAKSRTSSPS